MSDDKNRNNRSKCETKKNKMKSERSLFISNLDF